MQIPFLAWLLQGIPETIAAVTFIMVLSTKQLRWKTILKVALLQAVTTYLVRLLPLTPGVHTIILISTTALYLAWLAEIKFPVAAICSAIAVAILIIFELLFYYALSLAGVVSVIDLMHRELWFRILFGYPQILVLFGLTWCIYRKKYDLSRLFNAASKDW